jgi:hypothetical protein
MSKDKHENRDHGSFSNPKCGQRKRYLIDSYSINHKWSCMNETLTVAPEPRGLGDTFSIFKRAVLVARPGGTDGSVSVIDRHGCFDYTLV